MSFGLLFIIGCLLLRVLLWWRGGGVGVGGVLLTHCNLH